MGIFYVRIEHADERDIDIKKPSRYTSDAEVGTDGPYTAHNSQRRSHHRQNDKPTGRTWLWYQAGSPKCSKAMTGTNKYRLNLKTSRFGPPMVADTADVQLESVSFLGVGGGSRNDHVIFIH